MTTPDPLAGLDTAGLDPIARNIARDVLRGWSREADLAKRNRVSVKTVQNRKLVLRVWVKAPDWQSAIVAMHAASEHARSAFAGNTYGEHAQPAGAT